MEKVYCSTCLEYTEVDFENEFYCNNLKCVLPYQFRVFKTLQGADVFFQTVESWRTKFIFKRNEHWIVTYNNKPVEPYLVIKLTDVVNDYTLDLYAKGIMNKLCINVLILQIDGKIFNLKDIDINEGNCSDFCFYLHHNETSKKSGLEACKEYYLQYLHKISETENNKPCWDMCWAGVINIMLPIRIENILLGVIIIGQKKISETSSHFPSINDKFKTVSEKLFLEKNEIISVYNSSNEKINDPNEFKNQIINKTNELKEQFKEYLLESYTNKKLKRDELFFEEISYYLERYYIEGSKGVERMSKILQRLNQYFWLDESYCLFTFNTFDEPYKILAKGSSFELNEEEKKMEIKSGNHRILTDSIMLDELKSPEHDAYLELISQLCPERVINEVWISYCPLIGTNSVIFIFINPKFKEGLPETKKLTYLERDFIRKFVIRVREKINNGLSFNILLTKIGHELGSSVQLLLNNTINTITDKDNPALVEEYSKKNKNEIEQYGFAIENIKSVFVETDRRNYKFKKHSLFRPINEVKEILQDDMLEKYNVFIRDIELKGNSYIEMDYKYLRRAFYNLIGNALKYSFKNHYVLIDGYENYEDRNYIITISNFGVGILEEEIKNRLIFKELYRGKLSCDRNRTGNGMGLSIAEEIIKNHQGMINVESTNAIELKNKKVIYDKPFDINKFMNENQEINTIGHLNIFKIILPFYQKD